MIVISLLYMSIFFSILVKRATIKTLNYVVMITCADGRLSFLFALSSCLRQGVIIYRTTFVNNGVSPSQFAYIAFTFDFLNFLTSLWPAHYRQFKRPLHSFAEWPQFRHLNHCLTLGGSLQALQR